MSTRVPTAFSPGSGCVYEGGDPLLHASVPLSGCLVLGANAQRHREQCRSEASFGGLMSERQKPLGTRPNISRCQAWQARCLVAIDAVAMYISARRH